MGCDRRKKFPRATSKTQNCRSAKNNPRSEKVASHPPVSENSIARKPAHRLNYTVSHVKKFVY
jgi:hypothetical protein